MNQVCQAIQELRANIIVLQGQERITVNKIAVCIHAYNEERFLAETIASVLAQTFGDFDLIISDNHSTDGTVKIIQDFQSRDKRVIAWQPDHFCKSLEHARYMIARVGQMDYDSTLIIGAHDLISTQYLESLYNAYRQNPGAAIVIARGFEIDHVGNVLREWPPLPQLKGGHINFRPLITLLGLYYNLAAFGLWPKRVRNAVKIRHDCMGADHLYIAEASLHGDIINEPNAVIYTRNIESVTQGNHYIKKHISDDLRPENMVADFEKQMEWVCHINDLAFANFPETYQNISIAAAMGCYYTRYLAGTFKGVDEALAMWLDSDSGRNIASQMNNIGSVIRQKRADKTHS